MIGSNLYLRNKNNEQQNDITAMKLMLLKLAVSDGFSKRASKIIVIAADAISPTELARKPFSILATLAIFSYFRKKLYMRIEVKKPGKELPKVAATAPGMPAIWMPTNVAAFTTKGPGVICEIVMISVYS